MVAITKLSKTEREVLYLLSTEHNTPKQIAQRRKTTLRAVQLIIKNLSKKGFISNHSKNLRFCSGTTLSEVKKSSFLLLSNTKNAIRLHAIELNISLLWKDKTYNNLIGKFIKIENDTIKCFKESIEVYINKSFYGKDTNQATKESQDYINLLLGRIENKLKVLVTKEGKNNITVVNSHYAELDNELAIETNREDLQLRFKGYDGKVWLIVDKSLNGNELEAIHPKNSKEDMDKVKKHFDDIRQNNPPKLSELSEGLNNTAKLMESMAIGLKTLTSSQDITSKQLNTLITILTPKIDDKPLSKEQKKIPDYIG